MSMEVAEVPGASAELSAARSGRAHPPSARRAASPTTKPIATDVIVTLESEVSVPRVRLRVAAMTQ